MDIVGQEIWTMFSSLMDDAHDTFNQRIIIWRRQITTGSRYGEDYDNSITTDVPLQCVINYNYKRAWPVTFGTEAGDLDRESAQVYFNKNYLRKLGFILPTGYWNFNPDSDRFILDGLQYDSQGDTASANLQNDDIFITVIIKRDVTDTGEKR